MLYKKWRKLETMLTRRRSYGYFYFLCDITGAHDERDVCLGKWEPFTLCNHPTKFDGFRFFRSGDETFLIYPVKFCDHVIKRHMALWVEAP